MRRYLLIGVWLAALSVSASQWRPSNQLLYAVRFVESSHGVNTWGDEGRSLGDFQLSAAAWEDVNTWRRARGAPCYEYEAYVWNRRLNRAYAADYLSILHGELKKRLRRKPTSVEVYAAYNMGLNSFAECGYKLARVNPTTARKCQLIQSMIGRQ